MVKISCYFFLVTSLFVFAGCKDRQNSSTVSSNESREKSNEEFTQVDIKENSKLGVSVSKTTPLKDPSKQSETVETPSAYTHIWYDFESGNRFWFQGSDPYSNERRILKGALEAKNSCPKGYELASFEQLGAPQEHFLARIGVFVGREVDNAYDAKLLIASRQGSKNPYTIIKMWRGRDHRKIIGFRVRAEFVTPDDLPEALPLCIQTPDAKVGNMSDAQASDENVKKLPISKTMPVEDSAKQSESTDANGIFTHSWHDFESDNRFWFQGYDPYSQSRLTEVSMVSAEQGCPTNYVLATTEIFSGNSNEENFLTRLGDFIGNESGLAYSTKLWIRDPGGKKFQYKLFEFWRGRFHNYRYGSPVFPKVLLVDNTSKGTPLCIAKK
jgi:hypothetical protein